MRLRDLKKSDTEWKMTDANIIPIGDWHFQREWQTFFIHGVPKRRDFFYNQYHGWNY